MYILLVLFKFIVIGQQRLKLRFTADVSGDLCYYIVWLHSNSVTLQPQKNIQIQALEIWPNPSFCAGS